MANLSKKLVNLEDLKVLSDYNKDVFATKLQVGSPLTAATVADMTDTARIYVYTGSETGYTAGDWYYYDGSDWVSGGAYNSTALSTDETLTLQGEAADAKAAGDALTANATDIKNLQDFLTAETTSDNFVLSGTINLETGEPTTGSTRLVTETPFAQSDYFYVKAKEGYLFYVYAWDGSTYLGGYRNGEFATGGGSEQLTYFSFAEYPATYSFRIMLKPVTSSGSMIIEEALNALFCVGVDPTLSVAGASADAKAVGDWMDAQNQALTAEEKAAMTTLADMPSDRYAWMTGAELNALIPSGSSSWFIPELISGSSYILQCWARNGDTVFYITSISDRDRYIGMTSTANPSFILWSDLSYAPLDATLSRPGAAADAGAVGDWIYRNQIDRPRNKYDSSGDYIGYKIQSDGTIEADPDYRCSERIYVDAGISYFYETVSHSSGEILTIHAYDSSDVHLDWEVYVDASDSEPTTHRDTFYTPDNTSYIRICIQCSNTDTFIGLGVHDDTWVFQTPGYHLSVVPFTTDKTLSDSGKAADAYSVGAWMNNQIQHLKDKELGNSLTDMPGNRWAWITGQQLIAFGDCSAIEAKLHRNDVYYVCNYKPDSTHMYTHILNRNGTQHFFGYGNPTYGYTSWDDLSYFRLDDTLTYAGRAADAKATGDKIETLNRIMTADEVAALDGSLVNMPANRYMWMYGDVLQPLTGENFPFTMPHSLYLVQCMQYGSNAASKQVVITRGTGQQSCYGLKTSDRNYFNWYDTSYKTVADAVDSLEDGNAWNILAQHNTADSTNRGVTFTWSEDGKSCTADGTASNVGSAFYVLAGGATSFPTGVEIGKTYHFSVTSTAANLTFGIYVYVGGSYNRAIVTNSKRDITIPSDASGVQIVLSVSSGTTVENAVASNIAVREAKTNAELETAINDLSLKMDTTKHEHFTISDFETNGHWYRLDGTVQNTGLKSAPIKVEPGRTYYSGWVEEGYPACAGAWLDRNKKWLAPIQVISIFRTVDTVNGASKISYRTGSLCYRGSGFYEQTNGYYRALEDVEGVGWNSNQWEQLEGEPEGCAKIVFYDIPEKGQVRYHWADKDENGVDRGGTYANLYAMTAPEGAEYIVLNLRYTVTNQDYDVTTAQSLSTMPLFAPTGYPNQYWDSTDAEHAKWQDKKLCVIGQSGTMVGRSLKHLPDANGPMRPLAGFQEYMIPYFKEIRTYGYSGRNYMIGTDTHTGQSIYDKIITGQVDLSDYDFFLLTAGRNDIVYTSDMDNNIGDANNPEDLANPNLMIGGYNALIDYIFDQTASHAEPPRIFLTTYSKNPDGETPALRKINTEIKKLCHIRRVALIDYAIQHEVSDETASRTYYDGTHANYWGNRVRGYAFLEGMSKTDDPTTSDTMRGTTLAQGVDLDTLTDTGTYYATTRTVAKTLIHTPLYNVYYIPTYPIVSVDVENLDNAVIQTWTLGRSHRAGDTSDVSVVGVFRRVKSPAGTNNPTTWGDWVMIADSTGYDFSVATGDDVERRTAGAMIRIPEKGTHSRRALVVNSADVDASEIVIQHDANTQERSPQEGDGVTFTWTHADTTLTVNGTASADAQFTIFDDTDFKQIFEAGKIYPVSIAKSDDLIVTLLPYYDGVADPSRAVVLEDGDVMYVPVEYDPDADEGLNGYNLRVCVKTGTVYTDATCTINMYNHEANFASETGPYLGYSDYIECPEYLVIQTSEDSSENLILNFYGKNGDDFVLRHDILHLVASGSYPYDDGGNGYRFLNRMRNLTTENYIGNRVVHCPPGTYVSAAMLTAGSAYLYGWNGAHCGPDISGTFGNFKAGSYNKNNPGNKAYTRTRNGATVQAGTGFWIPGDATQVWMKNAAILDLFGVDAAGNLTTIFTKRIRQSYALPRGYQFFAANVMLDYPEKPGLYNTDEFTSLSTGQCLNDYISCDSAVTPIQVPTGVSEDAIARAEHLTSIRWSPVADLVPQTVSMDKYTQNYKYAGIPYASEWCQAAQVGWHITVHTLVNALRDSASAMYYEHPRKGRGPGYGMVCSSFAELASGYPTLIAVDQVEDDPMIQSLTSYQPQPGAIGARKAWHHEILFGRSYSGPGYTQASIYQESGPVAHMAARYNIPGVPTHTEANPCTLDETKPYFHHCYHKDATGAITFRHRRTAEEVEKSGGTLGAWFGNVYDVYDTTIINGTARPYVGDKGVFTSEDNVRINIKDNRATVLYLQDYTMEPNTSEESLIAQGDPVSIPIPSGATYVDIDKSLLTNQHYYGVYTNAPGIGDVQEHFEYHTVTPFTYTVTGGPNFTGSEIVSFDNGGVGDDHLSHNWYVCFDGGTGKADVTENLEETPSGYYETLPGRTNMPFTDYSAWDGVVKPVGKKTQKNSSGTAIATVVKMAKASAFMHGNWGAYVVPVRYKYCVDTYTTLNAFTDVPDGTVGYVEDDEAYYIRTNGAWVENTLSASGTWTPVV